MQDIALEILERASQGDIEAFEQVYNLLGGFVYNIALKVTHNHADAEEVTQDVFMKIYHNLKDFQFRSSFKTWVYRVTMNTAINSYRKNIKQERNRVDFDNAINSLPAKCSTADAAIQSDNEVRLNAILETLTPEHKACLILREIEGLSYKEIAVALKIPVNTVRTRLKRAREAMLEKAGKGLVKYAV